MSSKKDYTTFPYKLTVRPDGPPPMFRYFFSNWKDHAGGSAGQVTSKILSMGAYGSLLGGSIGFMESVYKEKTSFRYVLFYSGRGVATIAGAGMLYSVGVNGMGNIREKDGLLNHVVGGILAGTALGARFKSFGVGMAYAAAFAAAGVWIKYAIITGNWLNIIPLPQYGREVSFRIHHYQNKTFNRPHEEGSLPSD